MDKQPGWVKSLSDRIFTLSLIVGTLYIYVFIDYQYRIFAQSSYVDEIGNLNREISSIKNSIKDLRTTLDNYYCINLQMDTSEGQD